MVSPATTKSFPEKLIVLILLYIFLGHWLCLRKQVIYKEREYITIAKAFYYIGNTNSK